MARRFRNKLGLTFLLATLAVVMAGAVALALRKAPRPPLRADWRAELRQLRPLLEDGRLVQPLSDGGRVQLTLEPEIQRAAERLLGEADPIQGAAVVLSVHDGRVLALAGRSRAVEGNQPDLALSAWAPAASVFKLVTTAALLQAGVEPDTRVCYHAGTGSVEADNLVDDKRDDRCRSLAYGLAKSQNAILGRLAADHLQPEALAHTARALGFGQAPPFELPVGPSLLTVPEEKLAFARVAAGFWSSTLTPLDGALLAATIARSGERPVPTLVDGVRDPQGLALSVEPLGRPARVLDTHVAHQLGRMMVGTTEWGSARSAFQDDTGRRRRLGAVRVAGKTGTLDQKEAPFLAYSWFVGFAPADDPQLAFAILLGRESSADARAAEVARALVATWLTTPTSSLVAVR